MITNEKLKTPLTCPYCNRRSFFLYGTVKSFKFDCSNGSCGITFNFHCPICGSNSKPFTNKNHILDFMDIGHNKLSLKESNRTYKNKLKNPKKIKFHLDNKKICFYCGMKEPLNMLTIEHLEPVSYKANNEEANMVTACKFCNNILGVLPFEMKAYLKDTMRKSFVKFKNLHYQKKIKNFMANQGGFIDKYFPEGLKKEALK